MQQFGLDIVTLSSHTYHALQPLDVNCFKLFKITFEKKKKIMVRNNSCEPNKNTFANWVNKALDTSLTKKTSRMGLKF